MAARRNSPVLDMLIASAFQNLARHWQTEAKTRDYAPYNIFVLTGAWDISIRIINRSNKPYDTRSEFKDTVFVHRMKAEVDPGFKLYQFYQYRKPGEHWSERQTRERLFRNEML
jgi:hypothetical protein